MNQRLLQLLRINDVSVCIIIAIISAIFTTDLFINSGLPATFDGRTHATTIAQFYQSFQTGNFFPKWSNNFANYGLPLPIISHQITNYIGATMNFIFNDITFSFKSVYFIGTVLINLTFYYFLRLFFSPFAAFIGTIFFAFAPYRIMNVYIRGALPEYFASLGINLLLISTTLLIRNISVKNVLLVILSTTLIVLIHPFIIVIGLTIYIPFFIWLICQKYKPYKKRFVLIGGVLVLYGIGIVLSSYYFLPLVTEKSYLYHGTREDVFIYNSSLGFAELTNSIWPYYTEADTHVRGNEPKPGVLEFTITVLYLGYVLYLLYRKEVTGFDIFLVVCIVINIFLLLPASSIIFENVFFMNATQHHWRFLSSFIYIVPLIVAYTFHRYSLSKTRYAIGVSFIILLLLLRAPELYGKNYTNISESNYYFTEYNLHGVVQNPIWTINSEKYPIKNIQGEILSGQGTIIEQFTSNDTRKYIIDASEPLQFIDYTFYFPGWTYYLNGEEKPIQFQNPDYPGVIIVDVPEGKNTVEIIFENTKRRIIGYLFSSITLIGLIGIIILDKKYKLIDKIKKRYKLL